MSKFLNNQSFSRFSSFRRFIGLFFTDFKGRMARMAGKIRLPSYFIRYMQKRFDGAVIAICAYIVRWLAVAGGFLTGAHENARRKFTQFIAFCLAVPVLKCHIFFLQMLNAALLRRNLLLKGHVLLSDEGYGGLEARDLGAQVVDSPSLLLDDMDIAPVPNSVASDTDKAETGFYNRNHGVLIPPRLG